MEATEKEVQMLEFIFDSLHSFRQVFSRDKPWIVFCMVVIGFLASNEMVGITSFCRCWGGGEIAYKALLHFFRSSNWPAGALITQWAAFVLSQNVAVKMQGRFILAGDHTHVPKDGRQIPGVVTLHQHSETQTKPSYFRGHFWGAISLIGGSIAKPFAIPLDLAIHQGTIHIGENTEECKETSGTRIVKMAIDFAKKNGEPCLLVLDAFFPCEAVFSLAYSYWSIKLKQPFVELIVRAKKNCVAYYEADVQIEKKRGRPKRYGDKVKLMELFDSSANLFKKAMCEVYGKSEEVSYMAINLLWKPTGSLIRFVLCETSHGRIILMCSNLDQDPLLALKAYCLRVRVETMFDVMKNLMGAFECHFWSKFMPINSRKPKKNSDLMKPPKEAIPAIKNCWDGYIKFVILGAIATGLLQLISLKFQTKVWDNYNAYLRTRSRDLPSERTVKHVVASLLVRDMAKIAPNAIIREIQSHWTVGDYTPDMVLPNA